VADVRLIVTLSMMEGLGESPMGAEGATKLAIWYLTHGCHSILSIYVSEVKF
jgi:hypothetical protein